MIVGGFPIPTPQRAAGVSPSAPSAGPAPTFVAREEPDVSPTYFRTITSISYGSLASAYQAMKAQEVAASSAILSGAGIPAAVSAYEEVIATGLN